MTEIQAKLENLCFLSERMVSKEMKHYITAEKNNYRLVYEIVSTHDDYYMCVSKEDEEPFKIYKEYVRQATQDEIDNYENGSTKEEVIVLGNELMRKHGLIEKGWTFELLDSERDIAGYCRYGTKVVAYNYHANIMYGKKETKDTILHEIAHALLPQDVEDHGSQWRELCIAIGGTGKEWSGMEEGERGVRMKYKK